MSFDVDLYGPMVVCVAPIGGRGRGLLQIQVKVRGVVADDVPCCISIVELGPDLTQEPADVRRERKVALPRKWSVDSVIDHVIGRDGDWAFVVKAAWPEAFFRADLLRRVRQFHQRIHVEIVVCGRCTDVSMPTEPFIEATPLNSGGRGFEPVMKSEREKLDQ